MGFYPPSRLLTFLCIVTCIFFSTFASPPDKLEFVDRLYRIISQHRNSVKDALGDVQKLLCEFSAAPPQFSSIQEIIQHLYTLHAEKNEDTALAVARAILEGAPLTIAGSVFLHSSLEVVSWLQDGTLPVLGSPEGWRVQVQRQMRRRGVFEREIQRGSRKMEKSPTIHNEDNPRAGKLRQTPSQGLNSPSRLAPINLRQRGGFASGPEHVIEPTVVILSDGEREVPSDDEWETLDDVCEVFSDDDVEAWHAPKVDIQLPTFNANADVLSRFEAKAVETMMEQINRLPDEAIIRLCPLPTLGKHDRSIPLSSMRQLLNMEESPAAFLDDFIINEYIESLTSMDKTRLFLIPSTDSELKSTRSFEPGRLYFWPVHRSLHWSLLTIKVPTDPNGRMEVMHYDSLHEGHRPWLEELRTLIESRRGACEGPSEICRFVSEQKNSTDCGVFVCLQARSLAREATRGNFRRAREEPYEKERSRKRIALELLVPLFNEDPVPEIIDLT